MPLIETVRSKDGTPIAYERRGHGPPLVMVHGSTVDHSRWGGVVSKLAEHFSLYRVDRRGRGASGDGPAYSIEREFEDVAAVWNPPRRPPFCSAIPTARSVRSRLRAADRAHRQDGAL
jgi:pimeloyl-ACP methyl ester carboxylesterase